MEKLEMSGTIRSLTITKREKKDQKREQGSIVVMNEEGDKIVLIGHKGILHGYRPEEEVTLTMTRANKTLKESLKQK